MDNKYAWLLACVPLFTIFISVLWTDNFSGFNMWLMYNFPTIWTYRIAILVVCMNCILLFCDNTKITKARGKNNKIIIWGLILVPVYLFIRASKIDKKYGYAITNIIFLVVLFMWNLVSKPFSSTANIVYDLRDNVPSVSTTSSADSNLDYNKLKIQLPTLPKQFTSQSYLGNSACICTLSELTPTEDILGQNTGRTYSVLVHVDKIIGSYDTFSLNYEVKDTSGIIIEKGSVLIFDCKQNSTYKENIYLIEDYDYNENYTLTFVEDE